MALGETRAGLLGLGDQPRVAAYGTRVPVAPSLGTGLRGGRRVPQAPQSKSNDDDRCSHQADRG